MQGCECSPGMPPWQICQPGDLRRKALRQWPCAVGPCAGEVLRRGPQGGRWRNDRKQPAVFRLVVFRIRAAGTGRKASAQGGYYCAPAAQQESVSSGSAFFAARASISACSIIKFFTCIGRCQRRVIRIERCEDTAVICQRIRERRQIRRRDGVQIYCGQFFQS